LLEIIATTLDDAVKICKGGADRIELISALGEGGLTPSYGLIKSVVECARIPVNVIIRPHSRNFVYTDLEIQLMKEDIEVAKNLGANGVVIGVLNEFSQIDTKKLEELLDVCEGLEVTFHRAIDYTNVASSVKILSQYQRITSILTSGGISNTVDKNIENIKKMIAYSKHIDILIGGGLNFDNFENLAIATGAKSFHFGSALRVNDAICEKKIAHLLKIKGEITI